METPHYVLVANEATEVAKTKPKSTANKFLWKIITGIIIFFVALDLLFYQSIHGFVASFGLFVLFIRYTFPKIKSKSRIIIWSVINVFLFLSLIVKESVLPMGLLIIAIPLYLWASFSREKEKILFPVELQFYEDYFIIYREKTYVIWFSKYLAMEYNKIFYNEMTEAKFVKYPNGALKFIGRVEVIRYKYNKDGSLKEKPVFHKTLDDSFGYIYTNDSPEIDFVSEIEYHSPIKITRDENFKG